MSCEIIADGFHIHPDLYKLLLRDKSIERILLITDSLKPNEQITGPLFANGEEMIYHDGVFKRKTDNVIAGSALTMIKGVQNLVNYGFSLEEAVKTSSFNVAQVMRYRNKGAIIPGYDADLVVFSRNFKIMAVLARGIIKKNLFE
jgi:N-acetylglucosamine-6-phosphate deacetylase